MIMIMIVIMINTDYNNPTYFNLIILHLTIRKLLSLVIIELIITFGIDFDPHTDCKLEDAN